MRPRDLWRLADRAADEAADRMHGGCVDRELAATFAELSAALRLRAAHAGLLEEFGHHDPEPDPDPDGDPQ